MLAMCCPIDPRTSSVTANPKLECQQLLQTEGVLDDPPNQSLETLPARMERNKVTRKPASSSAPLNPPIP